MFDTHALADGTTRVVIGHDRPFAEIEQGIDAIQPLSTRCLAVGCPDHQCGAVAAGRAEAGVAQLLEQWAQCVEALLHIAFHQGEEVPGQFDAADFHGGVFQFGLA